MVKILVLVKEKELVNIWGKLRVMMKLIVQDVIMVNNLYLVSVVEFYFDM